MDLDQNITDTNKNRNLKKIQKFQSRISPEQQIMEAPGSGSYYGTQPFPHSRLRSKMDCSD
jgi:hypothetical protein